MSTKLNTPSGRSVSRGTTGGSRKPLLWVVAVAGVALMATAVIVARLIRGTEAAQNFVAQYPGIASGAELVGTPAWVGALHAANLFLMIQVIRSGIAAGSGRRPAGRWTRRGKPLLAKGRKPATIALEQWWHVSLDVIWLSIGAVYVVMLFSSGRWVRLIPTSWDVFPNAVSVGLQYLSLGIPAEDGWVAYNALQMLSYGAIVFIVAPLAAITGLRMSALWPTSGPLVRAFPALIARAVHRPVMLVFVAFIVVHVLLVVSTGVLRNLNHMFAARSDDSLIGLFFAVGVLALAGAATLLMQPSILRPLGALFGKVSR
ncbi:MAG: cytochrome b/b6 domain-containing protein [Arachnia sp.]